MLSIPHLDAVQSLFLESEIETVMLASIELRTPAQDIRELIPTDNSIGVTDGVFGYKVYDRVGSARIIAGLSDDLPRSDVFASLKKGSVAKLGNAYGWSIFEDLKPAADGRRSLPEERALTARRAFDQKLASIALKGDAKYDLLGLLNQPNVTVLALPNGVGGAGWANKTVDEILEDLYAMESSIANATNDEEKPDTLLLPRAARDLMVRTMLGSGNDKSVMQYYMETTENIKTVRAFAGLTGAGGAGSNRAVMYRNSPEVLALIVPMDFTPLAPQARNLEMIVNNIGSVGGVIVKLAQSIVYADGL